ncbi:MAG: hypothetical protein HRT74_09720, partial [Flavobacteriales bacterium]|nr:hypothetical protein [Flavobacteriales bacterium]
HIQMITERSKYFINDSYRRTQFYSGGGSNSRGTIKHFDVTAYSWLTLTKFGVNFASNPKRIGFSGFVSLGYGQQFDLVQNESYCMEWTSYYFHYPNSPYPPSSGSSNTICHADYNKPRWMASVKRVGLELTVRVSEKHEIGLISFLEIRNTGSSFSQNRITSLQGGLSFSWLGRNRGKIEP